MKAWVNRNMNSVILTILTSCFLMLGRLTIKDVVTSVKVGYIEDAQKKQEEINKAQQDFNTQKTEKDKDQDRVISAIVNKVGIKNDEIILQQKEASTY